MPLSWNEIKSRALHFSREWQDARYEKGDTQSFYNDFFDVFGISRRKIGYYERIITKLNNTTGFIDFFWPGVLLIEQKSVGRNLENARHQVFNDYLPGLDDNEFPRYILLSDFQSFELLDLETNEEIRFHLSEFHQYVKHFYFIAGYKAQIYRDQDPVNIEASVRMSNLHKRLEEIGYSGHDLECLLVRLMFCLFADDTGIFEKDHFLYYLENHTKEDGSDLGMHLLTLFQVLNTPDNQRQTTLDEDLKRFPYVNGNLFADSIRHVSFDRNMRNALLRCCKFDWSRVSPALFGSLFQTVMQPEDQRKKGAHYTSEKNILKVISPLFLDDLWKEFQYCKSNKKKLGDFHQKLSSIRVLDPACGCGNFLILAYRELRELELEVLKVLHKDGNGMVDVGIFSIVDVDQFYGIEKEEFPVRIAETALWLVDHQMNTKLSEAFGEYYVRLPLEKSAKIVHGNALTLNWEDVIPSNQLHYIVSNPPFIGSKFMTVEQRRELSATLPDVKGTGILDYVCGWYAKASKYIHGTQIKAAFVSTNSITQGEQVAVLWDELINKRGIHIHFAHRTFKWTIDEKKAHGMHIAAVFVIIIGFASHEAKNKVLYEYETLTSDPHAASVKNINPYLVDAPNTVVKKRGKPISNCPKIVFGNMPNDKGHLILSNQEKRELIGKNKTNSKFIKPFISAKEFINGDLRWCLWLKDIEPNEYRNNKDVMLRVENVRKIREKSKRKTTQELSKIPYLFGEIRQPNSKYILIPRVSSENRFYIPIGIMGYENIVADSCLAVLNANLYDFGLLTSSMHMAWVRYVCGRLKSDYRYSNTLVYNNFPWPEPSRKQKEVIEEKAQAVLDERKKYPDSTLADLYDPRTMPASLLKAHQTLDKAVDKAYRSAPFSNEKARVEYLFSLYEKIIQPLIYRKK